MFRSVVEWVEGADDRALLSRMAELEERRRAIEAETAVLVAELETRKVHRPEHATMYGVLRSRFGWSNVECRDQLRRARLIRAFPCVGETLHEGRASVANITALAAGFANPRVGDRLEPELGPLLNAACRLEHDDLHRQVEAWERREDADHAAEQSARQHELRDARFAVARDGGGELAANWGELDAIGNREIFDRFLQMEWETDWATTVERHGDDASALLMPRTDAQRRADALTAIFERAASTPPDARPPKPVVTIHVDHHTFRDALVEQGLLDEPDLDPLDRSRPVTTDRRCETTDGHQIDPRTALQVALEGHVRWVIADERGIPIRWGRKRRLFGGAAGDAVRSMSTRCTFPGCRVHAGVSELDHVVPFSDGGRTDPANGGVLCRRHNRLKNRGYATWRDPAGAWHAARPDGTELPWD